jgi:uncharacterized protein
MPQDTPERDSMTSIRLLTAALPALALAACGPDEPATGQAGADPEAEGRGVSALAVDPNAEAELVSWRDLLPDEDLEMYMALEEGRAAPDLMTRYQGRVEGQFGTFNAVDDLDGLVVRMPGYILPLDYAQQGAAREFLLLPYHGACIHYPPPPPNQIVHLRSEEPVRFDALWEPVWVEGRMEVLRVETDLADSAYAMAVRSIQPYDG